MFLLAAKFAYVALNAGQAGGGGGVGRGASLSAPTSEEALAWNRIRPSIAILTRNSQPVGPAVFISSDGYAVANSSVIQKGVSELQTLSGATYKFQVEATDAASQLCLIRTTVRPTGIGTAHVADANDGLSGTILAVLPTGVLRAELTGGEKIGVDQKTKRTFPIQEVRIEQNAIQMGGALLFTKTGHLIGALFAALAQENSQQGQANRQGQFDAITKKAQENQTLQNFAQSQSTNNRSYGPQGLVVGYSPTWEVTNKAITGFLSPEKKAQYGLLGIFVMDNKTAGVEIKTVQKGSGADNAGLKVGDILLGIDGVPIHNQIDFSRAIYRLVPGASVLVSYQRNGVPTSVLVTVGSQLAELDEHQKSSIGSIVSLESH